MTAPDDRARDEQPAVWWSPTTGLVQHWHQKSEHWIFMPGADLPVDAVRLVVQPAPAGDDELREAEERVRTLAQPHPHIRSGHDVMARDLGSLLAEYDERGRELERLREELRQADAFGRGEFRVTQDAYDQAVKALERLREENAELYEELAEEEVAHESMRQTIAIQRGELIKLRARGEKAAAVVRAVNESPIPRTVWTETPLGAALDELAGAHGADEQDGGQDR